MFSPFALTVLSLHSFIHLTSLSFYCHCSFTLFSQLCHCSVHFSLITLYCSLTELTLFLSLNLLFSRCPHFSFTLLSLSSHCPLTVLSLTWVKVGPLNQQIPDVKMGLTGNVWYWLMTCSAWCWCHFGQITSLSGVMCIVLCLASHHFCEWSWEMTVQCSQSNA